MPVKTNFTNNKLSGIALSRDNILQIIEIMMDPVLAALTLWCSAFIIEGHLHPTYLILSIIAFSLTYPSNPKIEQSMMESARKLLFSWFILTTILVSLGIVTGYIDDFYSNTIIAWLTITPIVQIIGAILLKAFAPTIVKLQGETKRAVIVGVNTRGIHLAKKLEESQYHLTELMGFFEDRQIDRHSTELNYPILGNFNDLLAYIKENQINVIYLSLPMASQPRIIKLLDELKDTTASIYFVPDIFLTDLIQSKIGEINGMPIVAVRETPFTGINGLIKRITDILLTSIIILLISPLLLIVAVGVKLSSPGPIVFKQRRYGLDGEEILVYKFRSMTTCDNGEHVAQATRNDQRITKFGNFIRKTSLDELPQFVNVLQGRMSIVGPRPHAVSHNEMYRKLITGYMIRHKVKPGITGWAQVNGLRGETETLDKMQARIDYDIEYLRNWSTRLDLYIIFKTVWVVFFKGQKSAY
ncbi:Undecaprenyl-phosphate glucose phosphotransferase [Methylotenera mobilis JLW8]|uniref:Undecaprenyl-phosphate glucose phosphotransferase n=2 Tax=Methylotenera mobilis TaxID=359408 RepID=C6WXQ6_METML|nr:Undecaprenyl-phosphate glucose phosphotransferase [Methylotenera mobilis JLW8]